jgi:CheY-like chemotaxis protein
MNEKTQPYLKKFSSVLLIDDDSDEHTLFRVAIQRYNTNISCFTVFNCSDGYYLAQNRTPDVIFIDMNLSGTNGIACLRKIKKNPLLKNIPVFMYSIGDVEKEISTALESGAEKWIRKPNSLEDYYKMFTEHLS